MNTTNETTMLPISELHGLLNYDHLTGMIVWKSIRGKNSGKPAGSKDSKGRLRVEIRGRTYAAHHIAYAMYHDRWPENQVDHINQDKLDNRIDNLREATNAENARNRRNRKKNAAGYKGVSFHKGRYIARITVNYKSVNLGSFDTAELAAEAYQMACKSFHGEFACPTY